MQKTANPLANTSLKQQDILIADKVSSLLSTGSMRSLITLISCINAQNHLAGCSKLCSLKSASTLGCYTSDQEEDTVNMPPSALMLSIKSPQQSSTVKHYQNDTRKSLVTTVSSNIVTTTNISELPQQRTEFGKEYVMADSSNNSLVAASILETMSDACSHMQAMLVTTKSTKCSSFPIDYKEAFSVFDKNNDGNISAGELHKVMRALGIKKSKKQVKELVKKLDKNRNGVIDYDEFINFLGEHFNEQTPMTPSDDVDTFLSRMFSAFDLNGDGYINIGELRKVMRQVNLQVTNDDLKEMILVADKDGNGKIDFAEFKQMLIIPP
ncbi:hypothetical protein GJ496_004882 [Pomphorhynchus laevis]|nr:hypothetical protein GJ496_004882 [Pomphorhynchus laevis]